MVWVPMIPSSADRVRGKNATASYEARLRDWQPGANVIRVRAQCTDLESRDRISSIHLAR